MYKRQVNDDEAPVITCPANTTVSTDPGSCDAIVTYITPVGTDNCPGTITIQTLGLGSGASFPLGTTTETHQVTDATGNLVDCSFIITVNDNEAPTINCPTDITVNNDVGICGAVVTYLQPALVDNCPSHTMIQSAGLGSGATFPVGTTTETYQTTDTAGNQASCSFTVTVSDTENPAISCPANITVNNDLGVCGATISYLPPTGTDNCPGAVTAQVAGLGSGSIFPVGVTTETYEVTDAAGNTSQCSFVVMINDAEPPFVECPTDISVNNTPGFCEAVVTYTMPTHGDNCAGQTITLAGGNGSGFAFPVGVSTENYMVTDASGLSLIHI